MSYKKWVGGLLKILANSLSVSVSKPGFSLLFVVTLLGQSVTEVVVVFSLSLRVG